MASISLPIARVAVVLLLGVLGATPSITGAANAVPFKLGTFDSAGREFVGIVLEDARVLDLAGANAEFEQRSPGAAKVAMPRDMKELIARYEGDLGPRLRALAATHAGARPGATAWVHSVRDLKVLPPVRPAVILNAGANYPAHAQGIVEQNARAAASGGQAAQPGAGAPAPGAAGPQGAGGARPASGSAPGIWERPPGDRRQDNPYLFLKSPSVVVGANDDVVVPRGRDQIDWECEFAIVVGRPAKNVATADAASHIFGYTIEFDVSDRGGRNDRKMGGGPDWFIQKNHDTFAPLGPFIVPKEFLPKPMDTRHYFSLNGEVKQDANTSQMEYDIWEMLSYASNVLTLNPGDIVAMGSPAGTNIERANPRWMRAGDVGVCVVEGVGEQRHNIVAQP
jgi:2-keto-4-pentenoate hydratase/2-oxohepta-3-ene-1,7-dioic acid hydratase in catechol pathway